MSDSPAPVAVKPLPMWFVGLVVLLLVTLHTQVTWRHAAYWAAGVRYGIVTELQKGPFSGNAVVVDVHGVYQPNALKDTRLWADGESWRVLSNTATEISLEAPYDELAGRFDSHTHYKTGYAAETGLVRLALKVPGLNFTVADALLALCLAVLAGLLVWRRQVPNWRALPWPVLALLVIAIAGLVPQLRVMDHSYGSQPDLKQGLKEWIQFAEMLLAGYLFFRLAFEDARSRRWGAATLVAMAAAMLLCALWEYRQVLTGASLRGMVDAGEVDGLWGFRFNPGRSGEGGSEASRNLLAIYTMIAAPLLLSLSRGSRLGKWRFVTLALAGLALVLTLSLPHLVAALAGCLAVALLWRRAWSVPAVLGGALALLFVVGWLVPQHGRILMDSLALRKTADPYGALPMPLKGGDDKAFADWQPDQQKYLEMQAAVNAVGYSPLVGYGIGHYQKRINMFYGSSVVPSLGLWKAPRNFMEKDAHGLYFIVAVELGLIGLAALLWVLADGLAKALKVRSRMRQGHAAADGLDLAMAGGIAGALVALLIGGFFASFLVRGLGLLVMALIAYAAAAQASPTAAAAAEAAEDAESADTGEAKGGGKKDGKGGAAKSE